VGLDALAPLFNFRKDYNMKYLTALATVTFFTASGAMAADLPTIFGSTEYSLENENFAMDFGAEMTLDRLSVNAALESSFDEELTFDGVTFGASYSLNKNYSLYGEVQMDSDLEYSDAIVGAKFSF
jgi:hypothetical protein